MTIAKPKEEHPHVKALFDTLYRVRIPTRLMQSIEEQRMFGMRATGDKVLDNALQNEITTTWISINQMVEYFKDGTQIGIVDHADTKRIFDAITTHLNYWLGHFRNGVNFHDSPIDDLILLDKFAGTVYQHSKFQFTTELMACGFGQNITNHTVPNPMNFFKTGAILTTHTKTAFESDRINHTYRPHEAVYDSLADILKKTAVRLRS